MELKMAADKETLLTVLVLGGLALGGYWLIRQSGQAAQPQPTPEPLPAPPNTGNSDVVNPSPFGYSVGDPCKRFPSLCKFW
ncbi:hypothetical protein MHY01S_20670 [Meiothermus hypogaeus NBRC 106114]|uniref:Uncharacterized protein n=1 Tax=Meiothermus hypogaeus NBRC 106114 TaxID=1227553 RepID=A0A511R2R6_9DEIN|nr:hypothetical protein MHY01S_20670 [Meiothermus hypogaeus NBRC 106114]